MFVMNSMNENKIQKVAAFFSNAGNNFAVRLLGAAFGGVLYYFIFQTVVFLGLDTDMLKMLSAVVVAVFLGIPYIRRTYGARIKKRIENHKLMKEAKNNVRT